MSMRAFFGLLLLFLANVVGAQTPERILLWPAGAPGAVGNELADQPALTVFLPPAAERNGTAVVVCPGGGYGHLATDHEGKQVAAWLNARGIAAFMLEYRIAPRYKHPAPIQDAQRALQYVRSRAAEWGLRPDRVGIWGFSAGGHLASTAATHFDAGSATARDTVERFTSRPDFAVLAYPVITMGHFTHGGSRRNLLGESPDSALVMLLSNEKQVTPRTPPTFLFHTTDDSAVPVENALLFFQALRNAGVPAEMHIYEHGRHGVGLDLADPILGSWTERLEDWFRQRGLL